MKQISIIFAPIASNVVYQILKSCFSISATSILFAAALSSTPIFAGKTPPETPTEAPSAKRARTATEPTVIDFTGNAPRTDGVPFTRAWPAHLVLPHLLPPHAPAAPSYPQPPAEPNSIDIFADFFAEIDEKTETLVTPLLPSALAPEVGSPQLRRERTHEEMEARKEVTATVFYSAGQAKDSKRLTDNAALKAIVDANDETTKKGAFARVEIARRLLVGVLDTRVVSFSEAANQLKKIIAKRRHRGWNGPLIEAATLNLVALRAFHEVGDDVLSIDEAMDLAKRVCGKATEKNVQKAKMLLLRLLAVKSSQVPAASPTVPALNPNEIFDDLLAGLKENSTDIVPPLLPPAVPPQPPAPTNPFTDSNAPASNTYADLGGYLIGKIFTHPAHTIEGADARLKLVKLFLNGKVDETVIAGARACEFMNEVLNHFPIGNDHGAEARACLERLHNMIARTFEAIGESERKSAEEAVASALEGAPDKQQRLEEILEFAQQMIQIELDKVRPPRISARYLRAGKLPMLPFDYEDNGTDKHPWLSHPSLRLETLASRTPWFNPLVHTIDIHLPGLEASYLTTDPLMTSANSPVPAESASFRRTFVFAGRRELARAPIENADGRIILVVPEEDAAAARSWVSLNTDVLVIKDMPLTAKKALKLITARRLAVLHFSQAFGLSHFIMLDDNLDRFYFNSGRASTWADVYELLRKSAIANGLAVLSARTYRPEHDKEMPTSDHPMVDKTILGSKIFYFDANQIRSRPELSQFFGGLMPAVLDIWGEDFFMQFFLRAHGLNVGVLDRNTLLFRRSKNMQGTCSKTVRLADDWLGDDLALVYLGLEGTPTHTAFKAMKAIVTENISAHEKAASKLKKLDLAQLTRKRDLAKTEIVTPLLPPSALPAPVIATGRPASSSSGGDEEPNKKKKKTEKRAEPINIETIELEIRTHLIDELARLIDTYLPRIESLNKLFKHQIDALKKLKDDLLRGDSMGYFSMATGTGKTIEFLTLVALAQRSEAFSKHNFVIVAPTIDLVGQHYEEITKFNRRFDGVLSIDLKRVTKVSCEDLKHDLVAMNEGVKKGGSLLIVCDKSMKAFIDIDPKRLALFSLFIVDELHRIGKDLTHTLTSHGKKNRALVHGFSATPGRKKAIQYGPRPIHTYTTLEAVHDGFLTPWILDTLGVPFSEENLEAAISELPNRLRTHPHPAGDFLIEKGGILWVPTIEHAVRVAELLKREGIPAEALHSPKEINGRLIKADNKGARERFKKGTTKLLIAVDMCKLGFDAKVDYELIYRQIKDADDWEQMRGRALRGGVIFDHNRNTLWGRDGKIAYILTFEGALPEHKEHLFPGIDSLVLSPDYFAIIDEKTDGPFQIRPYVRWPSRTMVTLSAAPESEDSAVHMDEVRNITTIRQPNGDETPVIVWQTPMDRDCLFRALGTTRGEFIRRVLAMPLVGNEPFATLMRTAFAELGVRTITQWQEAFARLREGDNLPMHRPSHTILRLLSLLYHYRIHVYTQDGGVFVPFMAPFGVVDKIRGTGPTIDFHVAHVATERNGPLNHYERLILNPSYAADHEPARQDDLAGIGEVLDEVEPGYADLFRQVAPQLLGQVVNAALLYYGVAHAAKNRF